MLIGLDCAEPSLVLERWRDELPTISGLMERGTYGRLTSVIPPITVPAWSCMMASRRRPRRVRLPEPLRPLLRRSFIATSTAIEAPRLWDLVTRAGGSSIVLGVPGTYPPRPLKGVMVSCFLTPSLESRYTYPPALRDEIADVVGEYVFDAKDFRTDDKERLLGQIYEMTDRRFALARHLLETKPWDLFAMVEMGPDRMHHAFWKFMDPEHRKHEPGSPFESRSSTITATSTGCSRSSSSRRTRTRSSSSSPTTARSGSTAGSASTSGCAGKGCSRRSPSRTAPPRARDVGVDWPRTTAWGRAATTRGSSST